ncbi:hypothetical protein [Streptomyces scabiei]|uniref:hypothetical protein n=1 Tax=Streptomyces scabiei TaxID=1930 RepID=UPI0038F7EA80
MNHRPYPNANRARHQIERHDDETPPLPDGSGRPLSPFEQHVRAGLEGMGEALRPQLEAMGASLLAAFRPRPYRYDEETTP